MNIKQTTYNNKGPIQIQDHGLAYLVSYPSDQAGFQREKVFNKAIGANAWQEARAFAKEKKKDFAGCRGEKL
tara:strand:- start:1120 stop:1335 length:216 start_codon:yes stop_codon:yes gene_type:complete